MDITWPTTFALACAAITAAVVPGTIGYTTARLESADRHRYEVVRLRADLQAARQAVQQVSATCGPEAQGQSWAPPSTDTWWPHAGRRPGSGE
ncbi:hypothetical protein [Sphaerisporangium aureirubrum]|uniref:Minor tail protein n=1 Tax=Sphaerisporangium aureirubrum TaxID=1544736 RepID=A0ABW1N7G0_9ACTN